MRGVVEEMYVSAKGSAQMERVEEVCTLEGCGIEGDRYCEGTGFWTRFFMLALGADPSIL